MKQRRIPRSRRLAKNVARAREAILENIFPRLHTELLPLTTRFLEFCNDTKPPSAVKRRPAGMPFEGDWAQYYNELGAKYYIIEETEAEEEERFVGGLSLGSDPVMLGAVAYNQCVKAAYLCLPAIEKLCKNDPYLICCDWASVDVRPRVVYFPTTQVGKEEYFVHDILIINARDGEKYAFDPTGYQFGFGNFFFRWEEYKASFISGTIEIHDSNLENKKYKKEYSKHIQDLHEEIGTKTVEEIKRGEFWQ